MIKNQLLKRPLDRRHNLKHRLRNMEKPLVMYIMRLATKVPVISRKSLYGRNGWGPFHIYAWQSQLLWARKTIRNFLHAAKKNQQPKSLEKENERKREQAAIWSKSNQSFNLFFAADLHGIIRVVGAAVLCSSSGQKPLAWLVRVLRPHSTKRKTEAMATSRPCIQNLKYDKWPQLLKILSILDAALLHRSPATSQKGRIGPFGASSVPLIFIQNATSTVDS